MSPRKSNADGSELIMELFNRMPIKELKKVADPIAKRIGAFMVANGYRLVFNRWYLQEPPNEDSQAIDTDPMTSAPELWFCLYDGTSPDGRGIPSYAGRTVSAKTARVFLRDRKSPYWTGRVTILTDTNERVVRSVTELNGVLSC
jgi:hypothetical protein